MSHLTTTNPIFTFSAEIAKDLKPIWKYLADHVVQDRLTFENNEMKIAGFDGSHIQIMMLTCPVENNTAIHCYLKFVDLYKLVEKLKDYSFEIVSKEKKIIIRSQVGKRVRTLSLRFTTEPEEYEPFKLSLPPITTTFTIPFEFITEACQDGQFYSEVLEFNVDPKKNLLKLLSEGTLGDSCYEIEADELIEHKYSENIKNWYAIQFLLSMKAVFSKPNVQTANNLPIMFEETYKSGIKFTVILAGRVEQDDSATASPLEE